jgi:hypothetical protein
VLHFFIEINTWYDSYFVRILPINWARPWASDFCGSSRNPQIKAKTRSWGDCAELEAGGRMRVVAMKEFRLRENLKKYAF